MGRRKLYRQRARSEAGRVEAKTLVEYLKSYVRERRELAGEEAELLARDALAYLEATGLGRGLGEVVVPAIAGHGNHARRSQAQQPVGLVRVKLLADEDVTVFKEAGMKAMLLSRLARVVEEAYYQDALLDPARLCLLFVLSARSLRERLEELWAAGAWLPVAGMARARRARMRGLRGALAMEGYLEGRESSQLRRELYLSEALWQRWWRAFRLLVACPQLELGALATVSGQPPTLLQAWRELWERRGGEPGVQRRLEQVPSWEPPVAGLATADRGFGHLLVHRHHYTPAAAEQFVFSLHELAQRLGAARADGQVVYFGVDSGEPAGKSLADCRLRPVVLDYLVAEDWERVDVDSPQALKWARLQRLTTQAYQQGVALGLADLAYLLGISTDAVHNCLAAHPQVVLPLRGRTADMGPTLSHAQQIIGLYLEGYDETEIVRRSGHSYDSIERYLINFGRVLLLVEHGLPAPAIRRVTGLSLRVVQAYLELCQRYQGAAYAWSLAKVRRLATAHPVGKARPPRKEVIGLEAGKKGPDRYQTLPLREVTSVQRAHLLNHFELASQSVVGEAAVRVANRWLQQWEQEQGSCRLQPGELLLELAGQRLRLLLLAPAWSQRLAAGELTLAAVRRHLELEQLAALRAVDPQATIETLWRLINPGEWVRQPAPRGYQYLPAAPFNAETLPALPRPLSEVQVPQPVLLAASEELAGAYGLRPALATAMVTMVCKYYAWCCPTPEQLQPGQLVWLARSTQRARRSDARLFVPVVLTLLSSAELGQDYRHRGELKTHQLRQLERLTAEAWRQDAVLTTLDLEWLLGANAAALRALLHSYQEAFGVLLPTAGTILDMGRTLTHKTIVVELAMSGLTTQEIARRIYHTPEAVDSYLRMFQNILLLKHYGFPEQHMGRVTGHSRSLVQEYLALVEKHFPTPEALADYLGQRRFLVEKTGYGA